MHGFQTQEGVAATIDPFIDNSLLTLKQCYGSVSARLHGPGWKVSILCVMAYIWLAVILSIESNRIETNSASATPEDPNPSVFVLCRYLTGASNILKHYI